ncbi:MAG TPA: hypothetical protein VGZ28_08290 [Terriglobales bacterium]|jgi:hypothetical protein|nr:hypothetical protein [Terriglobales bacterium]
MANRGRPSKAMQEQALKQDASAIAERFRREPIHQPVDPAFDPYYQRILKGDLAAVLEYSAFDERNPDSSFYEVVGRLAALQSFGAAKHIISKIARRGENPVAVYEVYYYWYSNLRFRCRIARDFIREKYEADGFVKREKLWHDYVETCSFGIRVTKKGAPRSQGVRELTARSQGIRELKEWAETPHSKSEDVPSLYDLVDRFSMFFLVPKRIFFELAESDWRSSGHADRDRRYRARRMHKTPSTVARKFAGLMAGVSPSTMSHRNVRK